MRDYEGRVRRHLVVTLGFSRRNAEIAVEMFRSGQLTRSEEEVINRIAVNPDNDDQPMLYYVESNVRHNVADHLNYRITQAGGEARTRMRRRRVA